ncbi:MAG: hypothetical protein JWP07_2433 [Pseudonocardiales bacterium]|nr:hypothetical protein [Pseudonocardiales bacterium]
MDTGGTLAAKMLYSSSMTLVIAVLTPNYAVLTPNYAVLSSDRRITVDVTDPLAAGGAHVHLQKDTDTKTILVDQRYVMGFAGLGRVREDLLDPLTGEQRRTRVETWVTSAPAAVDPTQ